MPRKKVCGVEGHPRASGRAHLVDEHVLIVEQALGKYLDPNHPIHHVDGNEQNNANKNLVVCEDRLYHELLHRRTKALQESGCADFVQCKYCRRWEHPSFGMSQDKHRPTQHYHKHCVAGLRRSGLKVAEWRKLNGYG